MEDRPSAARTTSFIPFFSYEEKGKEPATWDDWHDAVSVPVDTFCLGRCGCGYAPESMLDDIEVKALSDGIASVPFFSLEDKGEEPSNELGNGG